MRVTLICAILKILGSTYIDETWEVTRSEIVKYASFVQEGQASHVFYFLKFRRVDLLSVILLHGNLLYGEEEKNMLNIYLFIYINLFIHV